MVGFQSGVNGHNVLIPVVEERHSEIELVMHGIQKMEDILAMGIIDNNKGATSNFVQVREHMIRMSIKLIMLCNIEFITQNLRFSYSTPCHVRNSKCTGCLKKSNIFRQHPSFYKHRKG